MSHTHKILKSLLACSALAAGAVAYGESTSSAASTTDPHALLSDYQRPAKVPASKSNPMTPEKVALGDMLFFDPTLSGSGVISCLTCHNLAFGWSDALRKGLGHMGGRLGPHTPTIIDVAYGEAARTFTTTAGAMASSAATSTQRSSDACLVAEQASNSASEVATGTSELSVKSARLDALRVVV